MAAERGAMSNTGRAVAWVFFTAFFGMLQLWMAPVLYLLSTGEERITLLAKVVQGGVMIAFCGAISAALVLDWYYSGRQHSSALVNGSFYLIPLVCVGFSALLYVHLLICGGGGCPWGVDWRAHFLGQVTVLFLTLVYACWAKYVLLDDKDGAE